jgi:hypothetical protein
MLQKAGESGWVLTCMNVTPHHAACIMISHNKLAAPISGAAERTRRNFCTVFDRLVAASLYTQVSGINVSSGRRRPVGWIVLQPAIALSVSFVSNRRSLAMFPCTSFTSVIVRSSSSDGRFRSESCMLTELFVCCFCSTRSVLSCIDSDTIFLVRTSEQQATAYVGSDDTRFKHPPTSPLKTPARSPPACHRPSPKPSPPPRL